MPKLERAETLATKNLGSLEVLENAEGVPGKLHGRLTEARSSLEYRRPLGIFLLIFIKKWNEKFQKIKKAYLIEYIIVKYDCCKVYSGLRLTEARSSLEYRRPLGIFLLIFIKKME